MVEHLQNMSCVVETSKNEPSEYLIYSVDHQSDKKKFFGKLRHQFCRYNNYHYTITIGEKLYEVRSSDLRYRQLTIIDTIESNNTSDANKYTLRKYPKTLLQVTDSFPTISKKYHVTIHNEEWALGYLVITLLLHLHESQRSNMSK